VTARLPIVALVGFMATGKSTLGPHIAARLGVRFVDLDDEIALEADRPIEEIFRVEGEAAFRSIEARVTRALEPGPAGAVVATGGGWMARPELSGRWPGAIRVWLRARPETIVRRLGPDPTGRPMLNPADPEGSVRRLLAERIRAYGEAEIVVDTDERRPEQLAEEIVEAVLLYGGKSGARGTRRR